MKANLMLDMITCLTSNCPSVIFIYMFSLDPQVSSSQSGMQHWLMLQTCWKDDTGEMGLRFIYLFFIFLLLFFFFVKLVLSLLSSIGNFTNTM